MRSVKEVSTVDSEKAAIILQPEGLMDDAISPNRHLDYVIYHLK